MSHQEKQSIFDQLVQNIDPETVRQGPVPLDQFEDWEDLLLAFRYSNISLQSLTKIIFEACDIVQAEQQKRIAENQRKIFYKFFEEGRPNMPICFIQANTSDQAYKKAYSIHGPQVEDWFYSAINDEEQLLMPENLIK